MHKSQNKSSTSKGNIDTYKCTVTKAQTVSRISSPYPKGGNSITKTRLFKFIENVTTKNSKFSAKKL